MEYFAEMMLRESKPSRDARDALERARLLLEAAQDDRISDVIRSIDVALSAFDPEPVTGARKKPTSSPAPPAGPEAELIDVACHDLKDPLAAIVMGAAFLARSLPEGDARGHKLVGAIQRSAGRLNRIVLNLLDFAKLERGRIALTLGEHDLRALLDDAARRLSEHAAEQDVRLVVEVRDPSRRVLCDSARIGQAIAHLASNAIRYSPQGGVVTLRAQAADDPDDPDGLVTISVIDEGPGISGERRDHIFDRYYHMRRSPRDGTGVGIAIARGLVELHGGELRLGPPRPDGRGTTFTLEFPNPSAPLR